MKCYNYKIFKGSTVVLKNSINSNSEEEALKELGELKIELEGTEIKITESNPSSKWSC